MSGRVLVVVVVLLLKVTESVVVGPQTPTHAPDNGNCSESVKLVPVLRLVTPASTTSPTPTSDTLPLPLPHQPITTLPRVYTQPHGTASPTTTPSAIEHSTPTLPKATLRPKKQHTTLHGKLKVTHYTKQHNTDTLDKTHYKNKLHSPLHSIERTSFTTTTTTPPPPTITSSTTTTTTTTTTTSSSFTSSTPPSPVLVTVPQPNLPPPTPTLPPPSPTLPLPTAPPSPSTTMSMPVLLPLHQVGEMMKQLIGKRLPLVLISGWIKDFQRPYLHRIRAVNHEIVDKVLQTDYDEYDEEPSPSPGNTTNTCHLPEKRLAHLFHQQTLLLLLLQALPQSLEEVEAAIWNPEITDYIFRPEKRAVFDVYSCRECYALDASGACREVFFCKNGENVFSRVSRRRRIVG